VHPVVAGAGEAVTLENIMVFRLARQQANDPPPYRFILSPAQLSVLFNDEAFLRLVEKLEGAAEPPGVVWFGKVLDVWIGVRRDPDAPMNPGPIPPWRKA
jgi:hypothetical protein